jgi:NhaA family Na+:H+ antiporter
MAGPALLYLAFNAGKQGQDGWGIPMATDIAFVVGATALLGSRAPQRLRVFLLALAIVDDIGAIVVIALVYSAGGIHPTLVAVALGLLVPAKPVAGRALHVTLERRLHPVSSYVVIPLFALANAGVRVDGASVGAALASPVFWGVVVGLAVGKLAGITAASLLAVRAGIGRLPAGVGPRALAGGAALAGIGFTVSLFIVRLAFDAPGLVLDATLGVLVGSFASGVIGSAVLLVRRGEDVNRS